MVAGSLASLYTVTLFGSKVSSTKAEFELTEAEVELIEAEVELTEAEFELTVVASVLETEVARKAVAAFRIRRC